MNYYAVATDCATGDHDFTTLYLIHGAHLIIWWELKWCTHLIKNNLPVILLGLQIIIGVSDNSDWLSEMLKYAKQSLKRTENNTVKGPSALGHNIYKQLVVS